MVNVSQHIVAQKPAHLDSSFKAGQSQVEIEDYERTRVISESEVTPNGERAAPFLEGHCQIDMVNVRYRKTAENRITVVALAECNICLIHSMAEAQRIA